MQLLLLHNYARKVHAESDGQDATRLGHSRYVALGAVRSYALACDPKFVSDLFKKLVARLLKATAGEADGDASQAKPLADLANVLVPLLTGEGLELALKVFLPMLSSGMAGLDDKKGTGGEVRPCLSRRACQTCPREGCVLHARCSHGIFPPASCLGPSQSLDVPVYSDRSPAGAEDGLQGHLQRDLAPPRIHRRPGRARQGGPARRDDTTRDVPSKTKT